MATEISKETKLKLSLETIIGIGFVLVTMTGMWFTLKAEIQEAKELPKNEWVEEWDAKVDERIPEPDVTRMEFDMKDQLIRQTIMATQEDVKEIKAQMVRVEQKIDNLK